MGSIFAFSRNVAIAAHFVKVRVDLRHPFNSRRVLLSLCTFNCVNQRFRKWDIGLQTHQLFVGLVVAVVRVIGSSAMLHAARPASPPLVRAVQVVRELFLVKSFPARPQGVETVRGHASCLFAGCNASIEASSVVWFVVIRAKSPGFVLVGSNSVRKACIPVVSTQEFS